MKRLIRYKKGSAVFIVVIILSVVSAMLSLGTAKVSQAAMSSTNSNKSTSQAQQYAESKAGIIKSISYGNLASQSKAAISNSDNYFDEVVVGSESTYPSDTKIKQKECLIRVYKGSETLPRATLRLIRYSVEASTVPQGTILSWFGQLSNIPSGFALCDGKNGTPDLRNRFIVGAGDQYKISDTGGADAVKLGPSEISSHYHTFGYHNGNNNGYFITTASKKTNASLPSGTHPAKWNGSGGGGWYGWDGSGWAGGQNLVTSLTVATEAQKPHENRPPYYALYYIMKL